MVVEFAFYAAILSVMLIGVIDFGLAYAREMAMSNAVRAGTQFALARRPEIGPSADLTDALISLQDIRDSVVNASEFLDSDPGAGQLDVTVFLRVRGRHHDGVPCDRRDPAHLHSAHGHGPGGAQSPLRPDLDLSRLCQGS